MTTQVQVRSNESRGLHQAFEGDDYLYISSRVTYEICLVTYGFLLPFIDLGGTIANVLNIIVFLKMGFAETINITLLGLSVSDLFAVLTMQCISLFFNPYFTSTDLSFDPYEVQYIAVSWPHAVFARATGMITAFIALERCLCVMFPIKVKILLTKNTTMFVIIFIFALNIVTLLPVYTVIGLGPKIDPLLNRSFIGMVVKGNRDAVESVTLALFNCYSCLALVVAFVCTVLLIRAIRTKSKRRKALRADNSGSEKPVSRKEGQAVAMVIVINIVMLFGYIPVSILFLIMVIRPDISLYGRSRNLFNVLFCLAFVTESLNSSVNIFIYLKMSSNYRTAFSKVMPWRKH